MTRMSLVLIYVVMTFLCWGTYAPVLHEGQAAMGLSRLRPFIFVGVAYFLVAVCVPLALRTFLDEPGQWSVKGIIWSLIAGTVGALGSLGVLLAFSAGGRPIFVMPLVFGCAPVVNTVFTMLTGKTARQATLPFFLGILLVALGAAGVLRFKPTLAGHAAQETVRLHVEGEPPEIEGAKQEGDWLVFKGEDAASINRRVLPMLLMKEDLDILEIRTGAAAPLAAIFFIAMTALCWGTYGPLLHKGQVNMSGSRMRPFICVGIAYFFVAILVPILILLRSGEAGMFSWTGSLWSLAAGTLGALGALGVIMAFNSGGRPVFVMPLVFGFAPVINTFTSMVKSKLSDGAVGQLQSPFLLSLGLVIAGATMVLIFAPRPPHGPKPDLSPAESDVKDEPATSAAS